MKGSRGDAIRDDRRAGEAWSWRGRPRWPIGGGGLLPQEAVAACGLVFDGPLLTAVQGAAQTPLALTIPDIANGLTAGGAAIACRIA